MPLLERRGSLALQVERGELVSVLGAPRSGKSRLALELALLSKPVEGDVLFRGNNPLSGRKRATQQRPKEVTLLVQNAEDQLFARTVYDDVAFGPRHLNLDQDEIERRVLVGLSAGRLAPDEIRERSPFALSGGERRRVALAGLLAMEPEVLILDEPTASLDPATRREFLDLLKPLRGRSAIVWLTTVAAEASLADRVYLLEEGKTAELTRGGEMFAEWQRLAAAGVELPATYALASALQDCGWLLPAQADPAALEHAIVETWKGMPRAG